MANERTFLSWMRTSLALSSVGVGVTQLFKMSTNSNKDESNKTEFLKAIGKPLGGEYQVASFSFRLHGHTNLMN